MLFMIYAFTEIGYGDDSYNTYFKVWVFPKIINTDFAYVMLRDLAKFVKGAYF